MAKKILASHGGSAIRSCVMITTSNKLKAIPPLFRPHGYGSVHLFFGQPAFFCRPELIHTPTLKSAHYSLLINVVATYVCNLQTFCVNCLYLRFK